MFRDSYQAGFLSILYSIGSKPLELWEQHIQNGYIKRITDSEISSCVIEVMGSNVATTYITCPKNPKQTLGIKLPYLVMLIKNMQKYFSFEVTILDDKNIKRRFRASNYQTTTRVKPFVCTMPMKLDRGFNQIQFNLSDFTRRAYGTNYLETLRVQIHCSCRIRRVFFTDKLYSEDELPLEYRLFRPEGMPSAQGAGMTSPSAVNNKMMQQGQQLSPNGMNKMPLQPADSQSPDMMMPMNNEMEPEMNNEQLESAEPYPTTQTNLEMGPVEVEEGNYYEDQGADNGGNIDGDYPPPADEGVGDGAADLGGEMPETMPAGDEGAMEGYDNGDLDGDAVLDNLENNPEASPVPAEEQLNGDDAGADPDAAPGPTDAE